MLRSIRKQSGESVESVLKSTKRCLLREIYVLMCLILIEISFCFSHSSHVQLIVMPPSSILWATESIMFSTCASVCACLCVPVPRRRHRRRLLVKCNAVKLESRRSRSYRPLQQHLFPFFLNFDP